MYFRHQQIQLENGEACPRFDPLPSLVKFRRRNPRFYYYAYGVACHESDSKMRGPCACPVHCRHFSAASLTKPKTTTIFCDFDDKICIAALQNVHGSQLSSEFHRRALFMGEMGPQTQKIVAHRKTGNSRVIITSQEMCRRSNIRECFEVNVL